jgi:hypothetical protein
MTLATGPVSTARDLLEDDSLPGARGLAAALDAVVTDGRNGSDDGQ